MEIGSGTFHALVAGYVVAGLVCLGIAALGLSRNDVKAAALNGLIGLAAIGYAGYLMFSTSESVWVFPYLLALPVIVAFRTFKDGMLRRQEEHPPPTASGPTV